MLGEARQLLLSGQDEFCQLAEEEGKSTKLKDGLTLQPVLDAAEEYHTRLMNMAKEVSRGLYIYNCTFLLYLVMK